MKVSIGDIFESPAKTLVNTVNCVGVMGKGIAKEFKRRYPQMFEDYVERCEAGEVRPGEPYLYTDLTGTSIVNFPTKEHWRSPAKLKDIIHGLDVFAENYKKWGIDSVAFPPLGCGNGGLDWRIVGPILYQKLSGLDATVELYAPFGTPREWLGDALRSAPVKGTASGSRRSVRQQTTPGLVAVLEALHQLESQPHAPPVGRIIFQKICYVLTELGVPTEFRFRQGNYGPFSPEVKDAIGSLANSNLLYEEQLGRMNLVTTGPEFPRVRKEFDKDLKPYLDKVAKTVDLFSRIKDTKQAEAVTTVLYAVRALKAKPNGKPISEQDVFDYIFEWKKNWTSDEKREAIADSIRNLVTLDWLDVEFSDSLPVD